MKNTLLGLVMVIKQLYFLKKIVFFLMENSKLQYPLNVQKNIKSGNTFWDYRLLVAWSHCYWLSSLFCLSGTFIKYINFISSHHKLLRWKPGTPNGYNRYFTVFTLFRNNVALKRNTILYILHVFTFSVTVEVYKCSK